MKEPVNDPWRLLDNCNRMIGEASRETKGREERVAYFESLCDRAAVAVGVFGVFFFVATLAAPYMPTALSPGARRVVETAPLAVWAAWWALATYWRRQIRHHLRERHAFVTRAQFLLVHIDLALSDTRRRGGDRELPTSLREQAGLLAGLIDGTPTEAR